MSLYVARCELNLTDGRTGPITDFKTFIDKTRTVRKQVPLQHKTGHIEVTQRFQFEVDYVIPRGTVAVSFEQVSDATFTVTFEGDSQNQIVYGGVYTLDVGDASVDGENEVVRKITFGAESRKEGEHGRSTGDLASLT